MSTKPRLEKLSSAARAACGPKCRALLFCAAVVLLTMLPIVENYRDKPRDSFPLSYYPMFSKQRDDTQRLTYIIGTDGKGEKHFIHYKYAGTGGMNQVRKQIRKARRVGQADELCERIAREVARRGKGSLAKIRKVEIVKGEFRLSDFYEGRIVPTELEVVASAKVERR